MTKQIKRSITRFLKGFTLVELIIVIAIIAILSVTAFMTITKWIGESRDSRRLSDIGSIHRALNYNYVDQSTLEKYPEPDNPQTITGENGETLWKQGVFGSTAIEEISTLTKTPEDPTGEKYEYSVTDDQETYEVYAKLENGEEISYLTDKAYAKPEKYIAKRGNYNGYIVGVTSDNNNYKLYNAPSLHLITGAQLTSGTQQLYQEGEKENIETTITGTNISDLYNGSNVEDTLNTISENYPEITDTTKAQEIVNSAGNSSESVDTSSSDDSGGTSALITSTDCTDAGWYWVDSAKDNQGDGYCISPRMLSQSTNNSGEGVSWNGYGDGTESNISNYNGWLHSRTELGSNVYGATGLLPDYTCTAIGSASSDHAGSSDTIKNRMQWMTNNLTSTQVGSVSRIGGTYKPSNHLSIPAIVVADCIDGSKDLGAGTTHNSISRSDYTSTTDNTTTRDNRNKYLLGWTNEKGSHLPSAYSDFSSAYNDSLSSNKGEYQKACDNGVGDLGSDSTDNKRIWLASVGSFDGTRSGRLVRSLGSNGCENQYYGNPGYRGGKISARFVVRP